MTVTITGSSLTLDEVMRVARCRERVVVDPDVAGRMAVGRSVVEKVVATGAPAYGITTGVAARKRHRLIPDEQAEHNHLMIETLLVGQGPPAPEDVVRATILRLVNGFATGRAGVRPLIVERLVAALNDGASVSVGIHGSVGMADLAPMAELARGILGDLELAPKEAVSLVDNNAFSTAIAALAIHDLERLLDAFDAAAALELEAFEANLNILHRAAAESRPFPGVEQVIARLRTLLDGSSLWLDGSARNLQDPLSFRCIPQVHGAAREALAYGRRQLAIELNASQENPLIVPEEQRIISVGNFDPIVLATALDFLRLALAPVVTSACERLIKLMQAPSSGLPEGLSHRPDFATTVFPQFIYAAAAIAGEARTLAAPVSYELPTTSIAEGIEDRVSMAPLAARRLGEMVELGERIAAIELAVAMQAIQLRAPAVMGSGTAAVLASVRACRGDRMGDVRPLVELVRSGLLSAIPSPIR
jgi:histidine ammonia-lyase